MAPKGKKPAAKKPAAAPAKAAAPKAAAPATAKPENAITGVMIRNLDFEGLSHESVSQCFAHCGPVAEVRLRAGKYVLVFFEKRSQALKATEMNGKVVKGTKIAVKFAKHAEATKPRDGNMSTVFCGDMPGCTTEKQLRAHFASCGKIVRVRIYERRHHGFVYFSNAAEASAAMKLADSPFSHGKDVSEMKVVPRQLQRKLTLALSMRTKEWDAERAEKRFNRRAPSQLEAGLRKSEARKAGRVAAAAAKDAEAAKNPVAKKDSKTKK